MKKKTLIPVIVILVLSFAAVAMARGGYHNGGRWDAYEQLTPEKQVQVQAIIKKYEDTFQTLKSQQWAKRTELNALVNSGKADKETIHTLVKELSDAREKMFTTHQKMADEIEKEAGITFPARGMGPSNGMGQNRGNKGCANYSRGNCGGGYGSQGCPGYNQ